MRHVTVVATLFAVLAVALPGQTQIWRVIGTQLNNQFGGFLAPLGSDIDNDGVADVLVTSRDFLGTGLDLVHLLSGRTGSLLRTAPFGQVRSLAAREDVDGDGVSDYLVGGVGGLQIVVSRAL